MIKQRKRPRRSQKISDDDDKENSIFVAWDDTTARSSFEASSTTATGSGISDVSSFTRVSSSKIQKFF
jgi:hypothetical protein